MPIDFFKLVAEICNRFTGAKKKHAVFLQAKMKDGKESILRFGQQVNQNVATSHKVESRERRIFGGVIDRKDNFLPYLLLNFKTLIHDIKITFAE